MAQAKEPQQEFADSHEDLMEKPNRRSAPRLGENAIDDPVRMYLMQMGRIPLLTRDEEVSAAVQIDKARFVFRNTMLGTDFMLRGAIDLLQKVHDKRLRLDRTIEVSVTNKAEKKRILLRLIQLHSP